MRSGPTPAQVEAGQAVYTKRTLAIYDGLVLGLSNEWIWRCSTRRLRALYDRHVTGEHLEAGVGTGYFLDRARFPVPSPRILLLDLNANCLEATRTRIRRYGPETLRCSLLEPIPYEGEPFASVGLNYVLHCLPGDLGSKAVVFDHLGRLLKPGGVLFGSTLLSEGVKRGAVARRLMREYNRRGYFANAGDRLVDLEEALRARFREVEVEVVGCAGVFVGRK